MTKQVEKRLYRFALYGRSGSGKTCILTALSMDRRPDPRGRTCSRLPVQSYDPQELHKGKAWLDKAEELLLKGELPDPTGVDLDPSPRYRYEFTTPDRQVGYVELIDYSGELINPDDESEHGSLANRLKEHFRDLDGILVLAETPRPDRPSPTLSDELRRLREAFGSLGATQEDERRCPLALVLTKWDRASDIVCDDPAVQYRKLPAFFDRHPSYRSLLDKLRNSVADANSIDGETEAPSLAEKHDGKSPVVDRLAQAFVEPDDTRSWGVFPVSAFGRSREETDGRDVPAVTQPLQSLGLEAPFVWCMQRRDVLDLKELDRSVSEMPAWWRPRLWFFGNRVLAHGRRTKNRVPHQGKQVHSATKLYNQAWRKLWGGTCLSCLLVFLLLAVIQGVWDNVEFERVQATIAAQTTTDEGFENTRRWLKSYLGKAIFHPVLSVRLTTRDTRTLLHEIDMKQESRAYELFRTTMDLEAKARCASEYLGRFPNGTNASEAKKFLRETERAKEMRIQVANRQENEAWLKNLTIEWQRVFGLPSDDTKIAELDRFADKCSQPQKMPYPDFESDDQRKTRLEFQQKASQEKVAEIKKQQGEKYRQSVEKAIFDGEIREAGQLLADATEQGDSWQQLVARFVQDAAPKAKTRIDGFRNNRGWRDAHEFIDKCREGIDKVKPRCPALSADFEEAVREFTKLRQSVEQDHDRSLYQDLQKGRTKEKCGIYLLDAPLQTMRAEVQKYECYLSEREGPLDLTVEVKIRWGQGCETGNDNVVEVLVDNTKAINVPGLAAAPGNTTGVIGQYNFKKRLTEPVDVYVCINEEDTFYDDDNGRGQASLKVGDLAAFVLRLPNEQGTFLNEALFSVEGIPIEPELPAEWRTNQ